MMSSRVPVRGSNSRISRPLLITIRRCDAVIASPISEVT